MYWQEVKDRGGRKVPHQHVRQEQMEALIGGEEDLCAQEGLESAVLQQVHQQQAIMALKTAVLASTAVKAAIKMAANSNVVQ